MIFMMECNTVEDVYNDFQEWWNSLTSVEAAWGFLEDHGNDYDFHIEPDDLINFD